MAGILDYTAEITVPRIFAHLSSVGAMDSMTIIRSETTSDGAGGQIKTASKDTYDQPIPVLIDTTRKDGYKTLQGEQLNAFAPYLLKFPVTHLSGEAVSILQSDRLKVLERGSIPERIFRIIAVKNMGANHEAYCETENAV